MVRAVVTVMARDNAISVVTKVPIVPKTKFVPYEQTHFFSDEQIFILVIGRSTNKANNDKIDKPNAIHKEIIMFGIKLRLKSTEIPIPIITLKTKADTVL